MTKKTILLVIVLKLFFTLTICSAEDKTLNRYQLQSIIEFLAADELEGRAPGTRGGNLSELYLQSLFKLIGLEPAFDNGYLQPVQLLASQTESASLKVGQIELKHSNDFVVSLPGETTVDLSDHQVYFCGFGIKADQYRWDDFKNSDLRNKVLIVRAGDPGLFNPQLFNGSIMTFYSRWTYKLEQAARLQAAGILIVHTEQTATYDWKVVQNSWLGENLYLPDQPERNLKFCGWISEAAFKKIIVAEGLKPEKLERQSLNPDFRPIAFKARLSFSGKSKQRTINCHNVVGTIPGKTNKQIVISAHIDHLGMTISGEGDRIFNGAIDNGSAVAAMVLLAKLFKQYYPQPEYSLTFLACQAEEGGLLGSRHFVRFCNPQLTLMNVNFESSPVWEKSSRVMAIGAEYTNLEPLAQKVASRLGYGYQRSSLLKKALYYRSDQFSFSRKNIPGIWISAGEDFGGENKLTRFFETDYHTVKDEFNSEWDLGALCQTVKYAFELLKEIDQLKFVPLLKEKIPFPVER